jgi:cell shape-determining protein MreC
MAVDKRTFIIVIIIIAIVLPIIVFVFRKSFFPIIVSLKETFTSAALTNSTTGLPPFIKDLFSK